jgi:hypothetical protein
VVAYFESKCRFALSKSAGHENEDMLRREDAESCEEMPGETREENGVTEGVVVALNRGSRAISGLLV